MFGCPKPTKLGGGKSPPSVEPDYNGKNCKGENDEKECLDATADHLAGFGDIRRAKLDTGAQ
jgi:hypothetical protein